jgi:hypothetical protein
MTLAPGWVEGATLHNDTRTAIIVSLSEEMCEIRIIEDSTLVDEADRAILPMTWTGTLSDLFCGWRLS